MKTQLFASLVFSLFAASAFALPGDENQPILGEARDSQAEILVKDRPVAEGGAERTLRQQGIEVAEGGAERTLRQQGIEVAEGGAERTLRQQGIEVAEGGAERTLRQQGIEVAEGGAERTLEQHRAA
ncbi:MAG: hypothetical protein V4812_06045 [Pseudomonadota bacterium]